MKVELRLFASLTSYLPDGTAGHSCVREMDEGATIGELLEELKIPPHLPAIILVNGIHAEEDQALKDGDRLAVFPPIAGG